MKTHLTDEAYLTLIRCDTDWTRSAVRGRLPAGRCWADAPGPEPDVGGAGVTVTWQGPMSAAGSSAAYVQSYDGGCPPETGGDGAEPPVTWSWHRYATLQGALEEASGSISCEGLICVRQPVLCKVMTGVSWLSSCLNLAMLLLLFTSFAPEGLAVQTMITLFILTFLYLGSEIVW